MVIAVILSWIGVGLIVGLIANKTVNLHGDDPRFGIAAAMAGAVIAGIAVAVMQSGMAWSLKGMIVEAIAATIAAVAWQIIRRRSAPSVTPSVRRSY